MGQANTCGAASPGAPASPFPTSVPDMEPYGLFIILTVCWALGLVVAKPMLSALGIFCRVNMYKCILNHFQGKSTSSIIWSL